MIFAAESNPVADWFTAMYESNPTLFRIVLLLVVAGVVRWVLSFTIRRVVHGVVHGVKKSQNVDQTVELNSSPLIAVRLVQRTRTMGTVLNNLVTWVIVIVTSMLLLGELGFEVTGLIASAGIIGAALGFGAQNVIKDILNGLFMVFEDQLGVGDVVDLGSATGDRTRVLGVEEGVVRLDDLERREGAVVETGRGIAFAEDGHAQPVSAQVMGQLKQRLDDVGGHASDARAIRVRSGRAQGAA